MHHQKDFTPSPAPLPDAPPPGRNIDGDQSDDPTQALEEGDPKVQGRSRGQVIGQNIPRDGGDEAPESGRQNSVPEM